jgi:hypothetical protein
MRPIKRGCETNGKRIIKGAPINSKICCTKISKSSLKKYKLWEFKL